MPTLTLTATPDIAALGPQRQPQVCYLLLTLAVMGGTRSRPVNWAFVADASRSMRIPIVDEAQFRALIRDHGAQETLVDGVPVWQLSGPVPPEVRAAVKSPLDHVAHALHALLERLDGEDRFSLVACAEEAAVLNQSSPGSARAELANGIAQLGKLNLGDETDLAGGIALALEELRRGRDDMRAARLLVLTDGFTRNPEQCLELARRAAEAGVVLSTIGLGGEFQDDLLMALADSAGGQALFLRKVGEIPAAVEQELAAARNVAARSAELIITPHQGVAVRRITRIQPVLSLLDSVENGEGQHVVRLGDMPGDMPASLLLELLVPGEAESRAPLLRVAAKAAKAAPAEVLITARRYATPPAAPNQVREAAAWANIARLQKRALEAANAGHIDEAARMFQNAAGQLDQLGAHALAQAARDQLAALGSAGATDALAAKELTYGTRRLGTHAA